MTKYNTNLASEFFVLSMLHRLGVDASLTLGNKKSVDIIVVREDRTLATIEVKGLEKRYDWPADNIHDFENAQHFYVLVCFEGNIIDPLSSPNVWVIPANELARFIKTYNTRTVISRSLISENGKAFLHAWSHILHKKDT